MLSIVLFILILTFLILIHELGHFIVARLCKVKIEEFGIGIPPKAFTLFHWKGIPITFNWLLLGGFVRMEGEDTLQTPIEKGAGNQKRQFFPFYQRPLWQKLAVVLAGPGVNIIFGMVVFSTLFSLYGIPQEVSIPPTITAVAQNSPASTAGIQENDEVKAISKKDGTDEKQITSVAEIITYINAHRGETVSMTILREGTTQKIDVYARKTEEIPQNEGTIGVGLTDQKFTTKFYPGIEQPIRGTLYGVQKSIEFGGTILSSLGGIGQSLFAGKVPGDVAGPVGIAHAVQKEDLFANGWATGFNFAALLSINLGVMNLLPIPALDGGRIVLLILEKFIKHKKFEKLSQNLNQFGFLFLIGLLILITVKDVIGLLR